MLSLHCLILIYIHMQTNSFKIKLERFLYTKKSTIGVLTFNEIPIGYTLEPSVSSKDLIDEDIYSASIAPTPAWSRFSGDERYRYQIRLEDKNGRKGILIHIGNYSNDTQGCILVGTSHGRDFVRNSTICYESLVEFLHGFAVLSSLGESDTFYFTLVVTRK